MTIKQFILNALQWMWIGTPIAIRRLAKKPVQWLNETLYFIANSVIAAKIVLRNQLLRQVHYCKQQY